MGRLDLRDPWRDEDYETSFPPLRATDDHDDDRYYEDLTMVPVSLHGPESQGA
jgi:hypothetical protein